MRLLTVGVIETIETYFPVFCITWLQLKKEMGRSEIKAVDCSLHNVLPCIEKSSANIIKNKQTWSVLRGQCWNTNRNSKKVGVSLTSVKYAPYSTFDSNKRSNCTSHLKVSSHSSAVPLLQNFLRRYSVGFF